MKTKAILAIGLVLAVLFAGCVQTTEVEPPAGGEITANFGEQFGLFPLQKAIIKDGDTVLKIESVSERSFKIFKNGELIKTLTDIKLGETQFFDDYSLTIKTISPNCNPGFPCSDQPITVLVSKVGQAPTEIPLPPEGDSTSGQANLPF